MQIFIYNSNNAITRQNKHDIAINILIKKIHEKYNMKISKDDILYDVNGKPFLKSKKLYFNFSYSKELIVVAISEFNLGVDVEKILSYDEKILMRIYSKNEMNFILSSENKNYEFTKLWTYKEAYVKYKGIGIDKSFKSLNFIDNNNYIYNNLFNSINYKNYIITICSEDKINNVEVLAYEGNI